MLALNSRAVILSVEQEYHSLKYKLKRLVCNEDDDESHIKV